MQSKKNSLIESVINVILWLAVSHTTSLILFPVLWIEMTYWDYWITTLVFTVVSFVRSYVVRRFFTWLNKNKRIE